jgi:hypothetical protein
MDLCTETHLCECKDWAIINLLRRYDLGLLPVLNVEELLFAQENVLD